MGGVEVSVAEEVVLEAPAVLVVGRVEHQRSQVVEVGTLGVGQRAKDAFLDHVEDPQLFTVVAAVLEHDAMPLCLLRHLDEVNALLVGRRDGHLAGGVQSLAHGVRGHRGMPLPGSTDQDHVRHVGRAGFLPRVVVSGEDAGSVGLELGNAVERPLDLVGIDVADGGDLGVSPANQPLKHVDQAAAPVAQTEQGNPHGGQGFRGEVKHGALELGRLHSFCKFKCVHGPCRSRCPPGHQATQSKQATLQELPSLHALKVGRAR